MNDATVQRPASQFMNPEQAMFRVHEEHEADFDGLMLKAALKDRGGGTRPTDRRQWAG